MKKVTQNVISGLLTVIACGFSFFTGFVTGETKAKEELMVDLPMSVEQKQDVDSFLINEPEGNGIALTFASVETENYEIMGISEDVESARTVTATVTPSYATVDLNFYVEFENAASEWATGKTVTDYVTVTKVEDNPLQAVVSCLQSFGEPIILTVEVAKQSDLQASVRLDYMARYTPLSVNLGQLRLSLYNSGPQNPDFTSFFPLGYFYELNFSDFLKLNSDSLTVNISVKGNYTKIRHMIPEFVPTSAFSEMVETTLGKSNFNFLGNLSFVDPIHFTVSREGMFFTSKLRNYGPAFVLGNYISKDAYTMPGVESENTCEKMIENHVDFMLALRDYCSSESPFNGVFCYFKLRPSISGYSDYEYIVGLKIRPESIYIPADTLAVDTEEMLF